MDPIAVTVRLTYPAFLRMQWIRQRRSTVSLVLVLAIALVSVLAIGLAAVFAMWGYVFTVFAMLAGFFIILFGAYYLIWLRLRRTFGEMRITVDDVGTHTVTAHAETHIDWSGFSDWEETSREFILWRTGVGPAVLPREAFQEVGDADRLREILIEYGPSPRG